MYKFLTLIICLQIINTYAGPRNLYSKVNIRKPLLSREISLKAGARAHGRHYHNIFSYPGINTNVTENMIKYKDCGNHFPKYSSSCDDITVEHFASTFTLKDGDAFIEIEADAKNANRLTHVWVLLVKDSDGNDLSTPYSIEKMILCTTNEIPVDTNTTSKFYQAGEVSNISFTALSKLECQNEATSEGGNTIFEDKGQVMNRPPGCSYYWNHEENQAVYSYNNNTLADMGDNIDRLCGATKIVDGYERIYACVGKSKQPKCLTCLTEHHNLEYFHNNEINDGQVCQENECSAESASELEKKGCYFNYNGSATTINELGLKDLSKESDNYIKACSVSCKGGGVNFDVSVSVDKCQNNYFNNINDYKALGCNPSGQDGATLLNETVTLATIEPADASKLGGFSPADNWDSCQVSCPDKGVLAVSGVKSTCSYLFQSEWIDNLNCVPDDGVPKTNVPDMFHYDNVTNQWNNLLKAKKNYNTCDIDSVSCSGGQFNTTVAPLKCTELNTTTCNIQNVANIGDGLTVEELGAITPLEGNQFCDVECTLAGVFEITSPDNMCRPKTQAEWNAEGCEVNNANGFTLYGLNTTGAYHPYSSCDVTCPVGIKPVTTGTQDESVDINTCGLYGTNPSFVPSLTFTVNANKAYQWTRASSNTKKHTGYSCTDEADCKNKCEQQANCDGITFFEHENRWSYGSQTMLGSGRRHLTGYDIPTGPKSLDGYYPLYDTQAGAETASPVNTSHTHVINGTTYYMPEDVTLFHGNHGVKSIEIIGVLKGCVLNADNEVIYHNVSDIRDMLCNEQERCIKELGTWDITLGAPINECGFQITPNETQRGYSQDNSGNWICEPCNTGTYDPNGHGDCEPHTICGNQVVDECDLDICDTTENRLTGADATNAGSCHYCLSGSYDDSVDQNADCVLKTICNATQLDGTPRQSNTGNTTTDVTCDACDSSTYSPSGTKHCMAQTICGNQLNGDSRLTGNSYTQAGTCAACTSGYDESDTQTENCIPHTVCGLKSDNITSRLTGADATNAGSCAPCEDGETEDSNVPSNCLSNACTCSNGTEATGEYCTSSSELCVSCDVNYKLNGVICEQCPFGSSGVECVDKSPVAYGYLIVKKDGVCQSRCAKWFGNINPGFSQSTAYNCDAGAEGCYKEEYHSDGSKKDICNELQDGGNLIKSDECLQ